MFVLKWNIFILKTKVDLFFSYQDNRECIELTNNIPRYRVKYLHFDPSEYRRPPYYGTWRKRSTVITPKNPLSKDTVCIYYSFKKSIYFVV